MAKELSEYDKLQEEYKKKNYTSSFDEFRRIINGTTIKTILGPSNETYDLVYESIFKDINPETLFEGAQFLSNGHKAFISKFVPYERIAFMFSTNSQKDGRQIHTYQYDFKQLRNSFTKFTFIHLIKMERAALGFNGKLGKMAFKKDHAKQADSMIKMLQKHFKDKKVKK